MKNPLACSFPPTESKQTAAAANNIYFPSGNVNKTKLDHFEIKSQFEFNQSINNIINFKQQNDNNIT